MRPGAEARRFPIPAVAAVGSIFLALVLLFSFHKSSQSAVVAGVRRHAAYPRSLGPDRAACSLKFLGYEPSEWEARWQDQAETLQTRACATMLEDRDLVDAWMAPMNESFAAGTAAAELPAMQDDEVFSHFRHRDSCTGREVRTPIEPLVGTLRHPAVNEECGRPDRPDLTVVAHDRPSSVRGCASGRWNCSEPFGKLHIENKGYMVIQPLPAADIARLYPGRKYLFDLGTGRFNSGSLPWFIETFEAKGIVFDEIFGWELTTTPATMYWKMIPADLRYKLHWYNVGVGVEEEDPANPLNIVRTIYKPGDYIVFKLDIDNEPIEQALMAQLDADTASKIAELFFEQHFDIPEMRVYFHSSKGATKLPQVLDMFHKFRSLGSRLHYWP